jgi:hypothetical protein
LERKALDSCGKRGKQVPAVERNGPLPTNNKLYENSLVKRKIKANLSKEWDAKLQI